VNVGIVPQNLPAWTTQVLDAGALGVVREGEGINLANELDVGEGKEVDLVGELEVTDVVIETSFVTDEFVDVGIVEDAAADPPPGTRYQFSSGSPRHSPAVTPRNH
jgi:hypothetical protein